MGRRHDLQDRIDLLKTAADASPTGVVIVGVSRGSEDAGKLGFDHILVIYKDHKSGEILIAEMMPGNARLPGMVGSLLNCQNNPMPLRQAVRTWDNYTAVPLILTPEQDARFRSSLAKNMSKDNTYSFLTQTGDHCASAVRKALIDAGVWDGREKGIGAYLQKLGINVLLPGTLIEWAKERGGVYYESERFRTSTPDTMDGRDEGASPVGDSYNSTVGTRVDLTGVVNAGDNAELAGLAGANPTLSPRGSCFTAAANR
jgi:hypothetical protein